MKKTIFVILITLCSLNLFSQNYVGLSTGINNPSGLLGVFIETPVADIISIKGSLGIGGWGTKIGVGGKFYTSYPESFSYGLGFSHASGYKNVTINVQDSNNNKLDATFDYTPANMIDIVFGKAWGKKFRFNLEFGYSIKISGGEFKKYDETLKLNTDFERGMNMVTPGGLILGLGFAYGF